MTTLVAELDLDTDPFRKGLKGVVGFARRGAGAIAGAFTTAATAATGFAVAVGVSAVKATSDFEDQLASVNTLLTDTADGTLQRLRAGILALPPELGKATDLTEGLYEAISAGTRPAAAIGLVEQSAKLARAGLADLSSTTKALAGIMNSYGKESEDAATTSDLLFTTVQRGVVTLPELAARLGKVSSTAAAAGVSQRELLAGIATITKGGTPAAAAITGIQAALNNLISPSEKAKELAGDLKIGFSAEAVQAKGLAAVLQDVTKATGGNLTQLAQLFGSVEAVNSVLALTKGNLAGFREDLDAFGVAAARGGAITEQAFRKQAGTFSAQLQTLRNSVERILIDIGTPLVRELNKITGLVIENLNEIRPAVVATARTTINVLGVAGRAVGDLFTGIAALVDGRMDDAAESAEAGSNRIAAAFAGTFPAAQAQLDSLLDAAIFTFDEISIKAQLGFQAVEIGALALARGAIAVFENIRMAGVGIASGIARSFADIVKPYEVTLQALLLTTKDVLKLVAGVFFETADAASLAFANVGDNIVAALETAVRQIGSLTTTIGEQLLASGIPGIRETGQALRLLALDANDTATAIGDSFGTAEARTMALQEAQAALNETVDGFIPTGAAVVGTVDDIAGSIEGLAAPSEAVGAAIASINAGIAANVEQARALQGELGALRGGQEFAGGGGPGEGITPVDVSAGGGGGGFDEEGVPTDPVTAKQQELEALLAATEAGEAALTAAEKKGADDRSKDDEKAAKSRLKTFSDGAKQLLQISGNKSKALFKISKAANIAQALADGPAAFTSALKNPPGPPFTIPIAVAALASSVAQVASLKSQQPPAFQRGTRFAPGGMALLGEDGPELAFLPRGSQVLPNRETNRALGGARLTVGNVNVNLPENVTPENAAEQADMLLNALTERIASGEAPELVDELERQLP